MCFVSTFFGSHDFQNPPPRLPLNPLGTLWTPGNEGIDPTFHQCMGRFSAKNFRKMSENCLFSKIWVPHYTIFFPREGMRTSRKVVSLEIEAWCSWMTPSNHLPRYVKFTGQEWKHRPPFLSKAPEQVVALPSIHTWLNGHWQAQRMLPNCQQKALQRLLQSA